MDNLLWCFVGVAIGIVITRVAIRVGIKQLVKKGKIEIKKGKNAEKTEETVSE